MIQKYFLSLLAAGISFMSVAQPTHNVIDPEKKFKEVKELFVKEQYALAYPLLKELKADYPENTISDHTYLNDDINYYYIVCQLQLLQPIGKEDAIQYIHAVNNQPRREILSFHLAHYYFLNDDFANAIEQYETAGYDNLSNEQIADAKFEKAYAYFNLKQFDKAKPLFNEIHQLPSNKYYIPANYYYGFISYYDKQYSEALKSFKLVETYDEYKGVVPYYIAEIYYFQGKKEEALVYGESVLGRGSSIYYEKQLKLLTGQLYFEKKNYKLALPLLEDYVNSSEKVTKEVLYELSYCYYKEERFEKAINGFKQLSNERDSMGQNSMYLLGDLYLRTNQKANARNAFQFSAYNNSNAKQQQVSRFNYAKLSYELGYQDVALNEMKKYINDYPASEYDTEAKEILVSLWQTRTTSATLWRFTNLLAGQQLPCKKFIHGYYMVRQLNLLTISSPSVLTICLKRYWLIQTRALSYLMQTFGKERSHTGNNVMTKRSGIFHYTCKAMQLHKGKRIHQQLNIILAIAGFIRRIINRRSVFLNRLP